MRFSQWTGQFPGGSSLGLQATLPLACKATLCPEVGRCQQTQQEAESSPHPFLQSLGLKTNQDTFGKRAMPAPKAWPSWWRLTEEEERRGALLRLPCCPTHLLLGQEALALRTPPPPRSKRPLIFLLSKNLRAPSVPFPRFAEIKRFLKSPPRHTALNPPDRPCHLLLSVPSTPCLPKFVPAFPSPSLVPVWPPAWHAPSFPRVSPRPLSVRAYAKPCSGAPSLSARLSP